MRIVACVLVQSSHASEYEGFALLSGCLSGLAVGERARQSRIQSATVVSPLLHAIP